MELQIHKYSHKTKEVSNLVLGAPSDRHLPLSKIRVLKICLVVVKIQELAGKINLVKIHNLGPATFLAVEEVTLKAVFLEATQPEASHNQICNPKIPNSEVSNLSKLLGELNNLNNNK